MTKDDKGRVAAAAGHRREAELDTTDAGESSSGKSHRPMNVHLLDKIPKAGTPRSPNQAFFTFLLPLPAVSPIPLQQQKYSFSSL